LNEESLYALPYDLQQELGHLPMHDYTLEQAVLTQSTVFHEDETARKKRLATIQAKLDHIKFLRAPGLDPTGQVLIPTPAAENRAQNLDEWMNALQIDDMHNVPRHTKHVRHMSSPVYRSQDNSG
jgi:hypothetical protein